MRRSKNIKTFPVYAFVVDGEDEKWYLGQMKQTEKLFADVKPDMPKKKSLQDLFIIVCEKSQDYDKVFWIVDVDVVIKNGEQRELVEYFKKLKSLDNVVTIVNTPCLEFWYLLHYKNTNRYYENLDKLSIDLRKYLPDYEKTEKYYYSGNGLYCRLKGLLKTAKTNAQKHKLDLTNFERGVSEMWKIFDLLEIS